MDYKKILSRFYPSGYIILCGVIVLVYGVLAFVYIQQGIKQKDLSEKTESLSAIVSKPLSSTKELREEYDSIQETLAPIDDVRAIEILVEIAEKSGVDITPEAGKFTVPSPSNSKERVGSTQYNIIKFNNVSVQGEYENVKAFINDIESGNTIPNIKITSMSISELEVGVQGEELIRRQELRMVIDAVNRMMEDNQLYFIHNPLNVAEGEATNLMGDDPETPFITEGFPDIYTPVRQKGYTGNGTPRDGYVLYNHDRISPEDPTTYTTVNYINDFMTTYYYTCESNGQVRQWDGPIIETANEYTDTETVITELRAYLNIKIYMLPE